MLQRRQQTGAGEEGKGVRGKWANGFVSVAVVIVIVLLNFVVALPFLLFRVF